MADLQTQTQQLKQGGFSQVEINNWQQEKVKQLQDGGFTSEEIVKDCVDGKKLIDLSNCKILFSKKEGYGKLFLVREKESFHYVLYDEFKQKVSLAYPR